MSLDEKKIVLVGGGHSHALALKIWADSGLKLPNLVLVSESRSAPYSGMLTGYIAGYYQEKEIFIDLEPLVQRVGGRFVEGKAESIDFSLKSFTTKDSQKFSYDALSINTGGVQDLASIPGALEYGVGLKPVSEFLRKFQSLLDDCSDKKPLNFVIIGGGVTGVECTLALVSRAERLGAHPRAHLLEAGNVILPGHNALVQSTARRLLTSKEVRLTVGDPVSMIEQKQVRLRSGARIDYDFLVMATAVVPGEWISRLDRLEKDGLFLAINNHLMTTEIGVFACGDVARDPAHPVPRAGVYAVRQAKILAHNVLAFLTGSALASYVPQRSILNLMIDGEGRAFGSKGKLFLPNHRLTWKLKDSIDRRFMRKFL